MPSTKGSVMERFCHGCMLLLMMSSELVKLSGMVTYLMAERLIIGNRHIERIGRLLMDTSAWHAQRFHLFLGDVTWLLSLANALLQYSVNVQEMVNRMEDEQTRDDP